MSERGKAESERRLSTWLNTLSALHASELKRLAGDDEHLDTLADDLYDKEHVEKEKNSIQRENFRLARENLVLKPIFEIKKIEVKKLCDEFNKKYKAIEEKGTQSKLDVKSVSQKLSSLVEESERKSEELSRLFLKGQIECGEFLDQYLELRAKYHLREVKKERLMQLWNVRQFYFHGNPAAYSKHD